MASKTKAARPHPARLRDGDVPARWGGEGELKKRVVPKADGRYLIYYERGSLDA